MELTGIPVTTISGEETTFGDLTEGKVALVVNVASRCGLTPQYEQLENLQKTYGDRGFTVIRFPLQPVPAGGRQRGADRRLLLADLGVTFPMTAKVKVNGRKAHPIYQELKATPDADGKAGRVTWNFEKFLVSPTGEVKRFRPRTVPQDPAVVAAIEEWLPAS